MDSDADNNMNLIELSMRRPVTVSMATVALLVFGMVLLNRLGLTLLPDLSYPTLTIRTNYPGSAPAEVENLISKPIEEAVGVIKNVHTVRSISRAGQSDVLLEFNWGTDMGLAGIDVREKLDIVQLPLDIERPSLLRFNPSLDPIQRLSLSQTIPENASAKMREQQLTWLRRVADEQVKKQLEAVEGVAAVKISGGFEDEVQISIDQEKLSQLNLTIEQVAQHLKSENVNLSGGRLEEGSQRLLVRTINQYRSVEEMANTIVARIEGTPVYLRDIADVAMRYKEREAITRINGEESIEIAIYKEGDANTVTVAERLTARMEPLRKSLGEELKLSVIFDQSTFIKSAIDEVMLNGIQGGLLATIVLFLFLRNLRATMIVAASIPVATVISFNLMYSANVNMNIMSLGGLALAIGMLIDNAIVVLENIDRYKKQGMSVWEAANVGTREVAGAVTASTLTSVAVFLPLVFVEGIAGQLFRDQALTVTFSLLVSLLIALSLVPMMSATGTRPGLVENDEVLYRKRRINVYAPLLGGIMRVVGWIAHGLHLFWKPILYAFDKSYQATAAAYDRSIHWALNQRATVLAIAIALFAFSLALLPRLGVELIPQLAQGEFVAYLRAEPGTPLQRTDEYLLRAHRMASGYPEVDRTFTVTGTGNRLDASPDRGGENFGELNVVLKKPVNKQTELAVMQRLRDDLRTLPGMQIQIERRALFSFKTPLEVEVYGYDLSTLKAVSSQLVSQMNANDRFSDVQSTIEQGHPELQVLFDHEKAARLGLAVPEIAQTVVKKLRGDIATKYAFRDRKIDVVVRVDEANRDSIEEVRTLIVGGSEQRTIPLSAVAEIRQTLGPSEIHRIGQERVAVISTNLRYGDLGEGAKVLQGIIDNTQTPSGISIDISGQSKEMQTSFRSLMFALSLAIFLVYLVMASQFESLLHPFIIMFSVPLASIGAIFALWLTGNTISVVVFLGLILLAGIVVNNAIVLIDRINQLRHEGIEKRSAIIQAAENRLRPILMTTLTTVLGMLPLALGIGEGAEIRSPMAITVIGGLLVSTLLTLVVIPVLYSIIDFREVVPNVAKPNTQEG